MAKGYGAVVQQANDILHHRLQGLHAKKGIQVWGISEGVWSERRQNRSIYMMQIEVSIRLHRA